MTEKGAKTPELAQGGIASPRTRLLRRQRTRTDSERSRQSLGSGSLHRRPSYRRQSSFGLPHVDSFQSIIPEQKEEEISKEGVPWWTSKRLKLSIVCFWGFFVLYAQRVNLSIAIVCMVTDNHNSGPNIYTNSNYSDYNSSYSLNTTTYLSNTSSANNNTYVNIIDNGSTTTNYDGVLHTTLSSTRQCPGIASSGQRIKGEFFWDKELQGLILGAFFWGYTALQIPGGWLAERFGPRIIIAIGMGLVSILTLLTPICARISPYLLVICRVFIGVGEATMYPGAQVLWAKWSPPEERSRLVGFSFGGCQLGNALAFPIGSLLCAYGFDGGWPSIFYTLGTMSCLWCVIWFFYVRDEPDEMPKITEAEKKYIVHSLGDREKGHKKDPKPWGSILTSGAVWAILLANACGNYGAYMLLTQMPTYMKEVLKFDIKSNGVYSMIPYLVFWVFIIVSGVFADHLISKEILTISATRKLCCCIGMFVPALFLVILGFMDCFQQTIAVVLLTLSLAFCGFQFSSFFVNHGDIGPRYAGTIFGITNMGASVPGILAPYVVGAITPNKTQEEWRTAFYIAAGVYCLGAIAYIILAKGEVQAWAEYHDEGQDQELEEIKEEDGEAHSNHIAL